MTDFIREVDEEFRHDQFRLFLARYWIPLLALAVLVLAGVGGWRAYDYLATRKAQDAGGRFLDALDLQRDGKTAEALAVLTPLVKAAPPGYALLARFSAASDTGRSDPAAGATMFDAIAADGSVDPALRNLARLRAALLLVDTASYADLKARVGSLADANSGLRNSARELLAVAALKANQAEDAGQWLDAVETDPAAPAALRQRAEAMMGLVRAGSGDAAVATAPVPTTPSPATATAIPGLSLPSPTALPTEATPLAPAGEAPPAAEPPASAAPVTPGQASPVPPSTDDASSPSTASDPATPPASVTPGQASPIPPAALPPTAGATPPTSDTTPGLAPPK